MNELHNLMNMDEVCDWLRMKEQVVKRMCREGKIPALKIGKFWRFNPQDLAEWARSRK
jgi:excisionase family DNA binding protein